MRFHQAVLFTQFAFGALILSEGVVTAQLGPAADSAGPTSPLPAVAPASAVTEARYCVPPRTPTPADAEKVRQPFRASGIKCDSTHDSARLLTHLPAFASEAIAVGNGDFIVVYVNDGSKTLAASSVTDVTYSIGASTPVSCVKDAGVELATDYFILCQVSAPASAKARDLVTVKMIVGGPGTPQPNAGYSHFRVRVFPSLAGNAYGFWLPVGLFGTTFQSNADGITLAALPVGLAWGGRLYAFNDNTNYVGLSVFGSWTISPEKSSTGVANGNYAISDASPGALLDFNGFFYAGSAYTFDFRSGYKSPGFLAIVGLGPKLLTVLKAESTTTAAVQTK
jgi:hypothetical protein